MSLRKEEKKSGRLEIPAVQDTHGASTPLLVISLVGLIVSLLSGFHESIPFLKSLCSSACRDTAEIDFLRVPFWIWGAVFWAVAAVLAIRRKEIDEWMVGPALGVEVVLVLILIRLKAPCVFCITNAGVVLLFVALAFRKRLFWQQSALALLFFVGFFFWVPFENGLTLFAEKKSAHVDAGGSGIAATIGDEVITEQRLDVLLGQKLVDTQREIYRMKMERLEQLITDIIFDKEAKQQGKTTDNLVEQVLTGASLQVEESELDKYIQENHERLQQFEATVPNFRDRVRAVLQQQKKGQAVRDYANSLGPKYGLHIYLSMPVPPRVNVDTQGCPVRGSSDAPITVVELSDYQCPACRSTHAVAKQIRALYGDKIQWIYKEYPLKRHHEAFKAAEAAHCADDQGKFWEYQDVLFTAPDLSADNLVNLAVQLGMSKEKFSKCLEDGKYKSLVEKNIQDAVQAGVDRTPTFMINGKVIVGGPTFEAFKGMIDEELKKAGVTAAAAAMPAAVPPDSNRQ